MVALGHTVVHGKKTGCSMYITRARPRTEVRLQNCRCRVYTVKILDILTRAANSHPSFIVRVYNATTDEDTQNCRARSGDYANVASAIGGGSGRGR